MTGKKRNSISATVQRGYRSGSVRLNSFNRVVDRFDPEFTWNFEQALRRHFMKERATLNANAFFNDWDDPQVLVEGPSGSPLDFNTVR